MQQKIREYARLLVQVGVNLRRGQILQIKSPVDAAPFARLCAEAAYELGAREVKVVWMDEEVSRLTYTMGDDEIFDEFPDYKAEEMKDLVDSGAAFLSIISEKPGIMKGVSPDRLRRARIAAGKKTKESHDKISANFNSWCVAAVPNPMWAGLVFPDLDEAAAVDQLWQEILSTVHVTGDTPAVDNWNRHTSSIAERVKKLNEYDFEYLIYKNSLGTDLTIQLPEKHVWGGGSEYVRGSEHEFSPNMPTEEIFTLPVKTGVNGTVVSSMPLVLSGTIVRGIRMEIKDGKIISATADEGEEVLAAALDADEGSRYLGEVALVPVDSPISKSGIFFYNTLFDENASCHFAFGSAYPCFKDVEEISMDEMLARGMNDSMTHVDFMVGTEDLSIIGVRHDGEKIEVFRDGNFAI